MMRRLAIATAVIGLFAAAPFMVETADASPTSNTTSITLTCDKGVDSTAMLTLQQSSTNTASLGDVTISCGPGTPWGLRNRTSVPTGTVAAGYVTISAWTTSSGGNCPTTGPIPFKADCPGTGSPGAQLVVR